MIVVAIIGVLASISAVSYTQFSNKAKTVEAETALAEINRLETLYYDVHGQFSTDLQAIGFAPSTPLKYYSVAIQLTADSLQLAYRVIATPTANASQGVLTLTHYRDGSTVLEKFPSPTVTGTGYGPTLTGQSPGSGGNGLGNSESGTAGGSSSRGPGTVNQSRAESSSNGSSMGSGNTGTSREVNPSGRQ